MPSHGPPQPSVVTTRSVPPAIVGSSALAFAGTPMPSSFERTSTRFLVGSAPSFSNNVLPVRRWGSVVEVLVVVVLVVVVLVVVVLVVVVVVVVVVVGKGPPTSYRASAR